MTLGCRRTVLSGLSKGEEIGDFFEGACRHGAIVRVVSRIVAAKDAMISI